MSHSPGEPLPDTLAGVQAEKGESPADWVREIAIRRDREAFAALFRRFAPQVKRYLLARGASGSAAEELTQEVMLTVWRRADSFDPARATASTWIFAIARNRWIDTMRQRRPPIDPGQDPALLPSAPDRDAPLDASERRTRIEQALGGLPEEQAEIVRAAYFEDKSLSTMAAEKNLPLGTVKSRHRLALGRLREVITTRERDR